MNYMRQYETVVLVNPDTGSRGVEEVLQRLRTALERTEGREIRYEDWGRRNTAYEIQRYRKQRAHYVYLTYLGSNTTVEEFDRQLKLSEQAMLWQTIKLAERVDPETFDFEREGRNYTHQAVRSEQAGGASSSSTSQQPAEGAESSA